jgi:hypothetical protein
MNRCVNPDHLEIVTHRENILRSEAPAALNSRKTHCLNGHFFDEANTLVIQGKRRCRACHNVRAKASYHRLKG